MTHRLILITRLSPFYESHVLVEETSRVGSQAMGRFRSLYVPEAFLRSYEAEEGAGLIKACKATKSAFNDQGYLCTSRDFDTAELPTDKLYIPVHARGVRPSVPSTALTLFPTAHTSVHMKLITLWRHLCTHTRSACWTFKCYAYRTFRRPFLDKQKLCQVWPFKLV